MVQMQKTRRKRVEHALIESPSQQPNETAAVLFLHFRWQAHIGTKPSISTLKLGVTGCSQICHIDTEQPQDFLRRRPKIQNVAGGANFVVPLEELDLESHLMACQSSGHAARTGSDDGDATPGRPVVQRICHTFPCSSSANGQHKQSYPQSNLRYSEVMPAGNPLYNRFAR